MMHKYQPILERLRKISTMVFVLIVVAFNFADASDRVMLQLRWDHQFQFAGYYAAVWQGFYEQEGIHVTIKSAVTPKGILSAVEEVGSGAADFGIGAADILLARDKGVPLVVLASIFQHSAARLYSKKSIRINAPADFLKLRVARRVDDLIDVEFQAVLKAEGIDPEKIKPYPHQSGLDHLLDDRVDVIPGYSIALPFEAQNMNFAFNTFSPINYGVDFYGDTLFTNERMIKERPDLAERFTKASIRGWEYAVQNSASIAAKITQTLQRTAKMDNLAAYNLYQSERVKELLHFPEVEIGHTNPDRWEKMDAYLKAVGLLKTTINFDAFIFNPEKSKQIKSEKRQKIFGIILMVSLSGFFCVVGWVTLLRRNVRKRTRELSLLNEQLKESGNRYELAMQFANDGLYEWNLVTDEIYYSPGWKRMLGYELHEIKNEISEWERLTGPEEIHDIWKMIHEVIEGKRDRFEKEYKMWHKRGHWMNILSRANVVRDDQGSAVRVIGIHVDITQRKKAEELLKKSMETSRALMNSSTESAFLLEPDGTFITLNEVTALRFETHVKDLVGKNFYDYLPPTLAHSRKEQVETVISNGQPVKFVDERAGMILDNSIYPLIDSNGKVFRLAFFSRDISEEMKAKDQLRKSEEKFRGLFEQAPMNYQSLDAHGNFLEVNETWLQTMGYAKAAVLGKNFSEFLVPDWRKHFVENFPRLKAVGEILGAEFEMVKKDGSHILVLLHGKAGRDKDGHAERTHCVFSDISAQRSAEDTFKKELSLNKVIAKISQELLSQIFEIQKVSKIALTYAKDISNSEHGFITSIDKNTFENVGHTLTEMSDAMCRVKNQRMIFPMGDNGQYDGLWGHALNTRNAFFTNTPLDHPNFKELPQGHIPLKNYMAVPIVMGDVCLGLIALANSDRDYTDDDLISLHRIAELFALAIHRQAYETQRAMMENNLRQLQKNEAIGALAGGIAHDFNNILFPIIGFAEIMEEDIPVGSSLRESVEEIIVGAKRAKELVKQILTFSRQTEHELTPLKPQLVVKEVIKLIKSILPTTIEIRQDIDGDCRTILADPTQIHQIAMNLITNSYHAMMDTGGVLSITLQNVDFPDHYNDLKLAAGPHVLLSIKDTGMGMNDSTLGKIFDPYFTTKPKGKGTGLGLSVVYGIVKEYGGDIKVTSNPGQGSVFDVYLPALKREDLFEKTHGKKIEPKGTEKILLVDDELSVLRLEKLMLERLGYKVEIRNNSKDALEEIRSFPDRYDLVITDMTMPKMTGEQLTLEIRKLNLKLPIVICTGFSEKITLERTEAIGANGLLFKPVVKLEMAQTIRNILEGSKKFI